MKFDIKSDYSKPKYVQLAKSIKDHIELGMLRKGDKLPSVNEICYNHDLSRDTVERALKLLKKDGTIFGVKGKGCFVSNSNPNSQIRVLVLFNKLSSYKKVIFNSMSDNLKDKARLDFFIYHYDMDLFEKILMENRAGYNYYVIMPHFKEFDKARLLKILGNIEFEKVILADNLIEGFEKYKGAVYQDFKMDIYDALVEASENLKKYKKMILVFPQRPSYPYPKNIEIGFRRYCSFHAMDFEIVPEIMIEDKLEKSAAYIVIAEGDLANLVKNARQQKLKISKDVGVLSYNDTTLKQVLENGISVMTTDFDKMGETVSRMIRNELQGDIKNDFKLILRESL